MSSPGPPPLLKHTQRRGEDPLTEREALAPCHISEGRLFLINYYINCSCSKKIYMTGPFSAEECSEGASYDIIQPPTSVVPPLNQQKDVCHAAAPSRSHTRSRGNCPGGPCRLSQRQSLSDPARRPRHHLPR